MNGRFPKLLESWYLVPPVYINKVVKDDKTLAGMKVGILHPPKDDQPSKDTRPPAIQESAVRDDQAGQLLHQLLKEFCQHSPQVMVAIFNLKFQHILANVPANAQLPTSNTRGETDILIVHHDYGIILTEIKAVGDMFHKMKKTETEKEIIVYKKVKQALDQLKKDEKEMNSLLSDLSNRPPVSCLLMLPNIHGDLLRRVTKSHPQIVTDLCGCFGVQDPCDAVDRCLCADDVTPEKFPAWWQRAVERSPSTAAMTDAVYAELVLRFAGPVSQHQFGLHTLTDVVSFTARQFEQFVLTEEQETVLTSQAKFAFLTGPPGTGKTVALILKGREWANGESEVHVVSTWTGSQAAARLIKQEIERTHDVTDRADRRVRLHHFDLKEEGQVQEAVGILANLAGAAGTLCVLADEAFGGGSGFGDMCQQLVSRVPGVCLWGASIYHGYAPPGAKEFGFTEPLRTPPAITDEVKSSEIMRYQFVRGYGVPPAPPVSRGLPPRHLSHKGRNHNVGRAPADCEQCGLELAGVLKDLLNVGIAEADHSLSYRDVFVLTIDTSYDGLCEECCEDEVVRPASGLVRGLRQEHVPIRIVSAGDFEALDDVVKMAGPDEVVAADADTVRGLERAVVVWLQADTHDVAGEESFGRLDAMSRTNSYLIVLSDRSHTHRAVT